MLKPRSISWRRTARLKLKRLNNPLKASDLFLAKEEKIRKEDQRRKMFAEEEARRRKLADAKRRNFVKK